MTALTLDDVRDAFGNLEDRAAKAGASHKCLLIIHATAEEVLGELGGKEARPAGDATDLRARALAAVTEAQFDRAAWALLRGGSFVDVVDVAQARLWLVPGWQPGPRSNAAMLAALEVYRDKRAAAGRRGEASPAAHHFAKREGRSAYNRAIKG